MDDDSHPDSNVAQYNGKIIAASLAMLCLVVLFILALHIYARWFWRLSLRRQAFLWRGRSHEQQQEELFAAGAGDGLEKALVESMPTFLYKAGDGEAGLECAVCLCEFQDSEKGRLLPNCKHSFHTGCIDVWFLSHTTCPLCRAGAAPPSAPCIPGADSVLQVREGPQEQEHAPQDPQADLEEADPQAQEGRGPPQPSNSSSLPFSGWRWAGLSRSQHGVQFPTNVLFWGDHSHVTSRASSPTLEHGQRGGRSLPHTHTLTLALAMDPAPVQESYGADQPCAPDLRPQDDALSKSPVLRFSAIKRLLSSRERRVFPSSSEQDNSRVNPHPPATSIELGA